MKSFFGVGISVVDQKSGGTSRCIEVEEKI